MNQNIKKNLFLFYGAGVYLVFFTSFLHAVAFLGNLVLSKTVDYGPENSLGQAILVNILLLGLFAIQHSGMARPGFKEWWTGMIPEPLERSTFVLISSLLLFLLILEWRPIPVVIWDLEGTVAGFMISGLYWMGWLIVLVSTFMIDHFDLFGLRQVYLYWRGKEYPEAEFQAPALYQYVRHPIMLGFLIAFWSAPFMTAGHLLFAAMTTVYILIAIQLEERDLKAIHGEAYEHYRKRVSMLLTLPGKRQ